MPNNNEDLKFNLVMEEGKELNDLTIEERGYVNKFTWQEFQSALKQNAKSKQQLTAQIEIDTVALKNIEDNHQYVLELTPEQRHAVALYVSYTGSVKECQAKLEEFLKAEEADNARKEQILAQIPELNIESPYGKE